MYLIDEGSEVQRSQATCPRLHNYKLLKLSGKPERVCTVYLWTGQESDMD